MANYILHLLNMIGIYLILAYSLNLVLGLGGLMSFCHAIFYGIGAYAYTLAVVGRPGVAVAQDLLCNGGMAIPRRGVVCRCTVCGNREHDRQDYPPFPWGFLRLRLTWIPGDGFRGSLQLGRPGTGLLAFTASQDPSCSAS